MFKNIILAISLVTTGAAGASQMMASPDDNRIKTVSYNARDIVTVTGHYFYQTLILFADSERITECFAGDQEGWQIEYLKTGNGLIIKPVGENAASNLFCQTDKRRYQFQLRSAQAKNADDPSLTYQVKFIYPQDAMAEQAALLKKQTQEVARSENTAARPAFQTAYLYSGAKPPKPRTVIDDGTFTYFEFNKDQRIPAIFAVDDGGQEILVNHHVKGNYIVVERMSKQWVLRDGKQVTRVKSEATEEEESDGRWFQRWKAL